jgi:hypothetical protein
MSSKWSLSFWLSSQNSICIPVLRMCYVPFLSHHSWLDLSNYIWVGVQAMKPLIIQFSLTSTSIQIFSCTPPSQSSSYWCLALM